MPKFNVSSQAASPSEAQKHSNSRTSAGHGWLCRQLKPHSPVPCLQGGRSPLAWEKSTKFLQQQVKAEQAGLEVDLQQDKPLQADGACPCVYSSMVMVKTPFI